MIGRYRLEGDGTKKPSPWAYNMITDKGYDFWTKGDATLSGNYVKSLLVGAKPESISNLNPLSSITSMQTTSDSIKEYLISSYTATLKKSQTSAVLTHRFTIGTTDRYQVLSEVGLVLDNTPATLVTYSLMKSTEGLDVIPTMVEDKWPHPSPINYELSVRIPFITRSYEAILKDNDVDTTYKVSLKLLDTLAASVDESYSFRNPFKFSASMLGELENPAIVASEVRLSTYNKETKEAVYSIVFNYDGAWVNSPEKYKTIKIASSLGDYSITLLNPVGDAPLGFPDTLAKDLVIPFKVSL